MPRPIKKKSRKKEHETEVEIKDVLGNIRDTLKRKQKTLLAYSAIALSAAIAIAVILFSQYTAEQKARQIENRAYAIYHNLDQKKPLPRQEQYQQALELFQQSYSKKKSPRVLLYIANSYFELEKYEDALKTLNDFLKRHAKATDLLPIAYQKIAIIQLMKGDKEAALKTLNTLYAAGGIFQDYALIETARILEKEGKKDEAAAKYKELSEKFPASPFAEEAKAKLTEKKES